MNPAKSPSKCKSKSKARGKRRRSKTSLSPDKSAKKALELSQQLDCLIERLGTPSDTVKIY